MASCDLSANRCLSRQQNAIEAAEAIEVMTAVCSFITQALHKSHQSAGLFRITPITPVAAAARHMLTKPNDFFLCYLNPESSINSQIQSPL